MLSKHRWSLVFPQSCQVSEKGTSRDHCPVPSRPSGKETGSGMKRAVCIHRYMLWGVCEGAKAHYPRASLELGIMAAVQSILDLHP